MDSQGPVEDFAMGIKAVIDQGTIRPLEPLPPDWVDGQELRIEVAAHEDEREAPDTWAQEMDALTANLYTPEEWAQIEETLREADQQAKAWVRREMGLPE
ncbi:MAG TPA: hypothetical protein VFF52_26310 [Isosphaeraceae bacterium]|nr:hypothetical protein [Isosphaeraceae bacterium]